MYQQILYDIENKEQLKFKSALANCVLAKEKTRLLKRQTMVDQIVKLIYKIMIHDEQESEKQL